MILLSKLRLFAVIPLTYKPSSLIPAAGTIATRSNTNTRMSAAPNQDDNKDKSTVSNTNSSLAINPDGTLKKYPKPIPKTHVAIASSTGDIDSLRSLSEQDGTKKELFAVDDTKNTPLIWAANAGNSDTVTFLLQQINQCETSTSPSSNSNDSIINIQGYIGNTALSRAARNGDVTTVSQLLQQEYINPNICNDKMQYPLHFAAFKKHLEVVKVMLESGKCDVMVRDRKGRTPAEDTSVEEIRDLIRSYQAKVSK